MRGRAGGVGELPGLQRGQHLEHRDAAGASTATSYFLLTATGSVNVTVPLYTHGVSTPVPPGTYVLSVAAVNACGTSAPTAPITVTFP